MTCSSFCFAVLVGVVRYLKVDHGLDVFVISFWRNVLALIVFLPWILHAGTSGLRTRRHWRLFLRSALLATSSTAMFFAAVLMPLAEATALTFTTPLFTVALAVMILGETVGVRRWSAVLVGLVGVIVILRPGIAVFDPAALLALLSAATFAGVVVIGKQLAATESSELVAFYLALYMIPISFVPALFFWSWPSIDAIGWLILLGAVAAGNMYAIQRALKIGDANQSQVFDFIRLPFVALIAFVFFDEIPLVWTWLGAALIFGSATYVAYRESRNIRIAGGKTPTK